jgi:enoyl-[acyl-carrier-protein] reductase (NADH)
VAAEVGAAGGKAIAVQGDLAKTADVEAMVAKAVAAFGPIDILVNNAAVLDFKPLSDIDEAHFHRLFNTNVLGLLTTTRAAVANFNPAGGSVINISSLSALGNAPGSVVYSSSKAAVNATTKVLALELAGRKNPRQRHHARLLRYGRCARDRREGQRAGSPAHCRHALGKATRPSFRSQPGRDFPRLTRVGVD